MNLILEIKAESVKEKKFKEQNFHIKKVGHISHKVHDRIFNNIWKEKGKFIPKALHILLGDQTLSVR